MTKVEALDLFKSGYGSDKKYLESCKADRTQVRTDWHAFTDSLCKNGDISQHQYDSWVNPKEFA